MPSVFRRSRALLAALLVGTALVLLAFRQGLLGGGASAADKPRATLREIHGLLHLVAQSNGTLAPGAVDPAQPVSFEDYAAASGDADFVGRAMRLMKDSPVVVFSKVCAFVRMTTLVCLLTCLSSRTARACFAGVVRGAHIADGIASGTPKRPRACSRNTTSPRRQSLSSSTSAVRASFPCFPAPAYAALGSRRRGDPADPRAPHGPAHGPEHPRAGHVDRRLGRRPRAARGRQAPRCLHRAWCARAGRMTAWAGPARCGVNVTLGLCRPCCPTRCARADAGEIDERAWAPSPPQAST
jgi:hypothetical protein